MEIEFMNGRYNRQAVIIALVNVDILLTYRFLSYEKIKYDILIKKSILIVDVLCFLLNAS